MRLRDAFGATKRQAYAFSDQPGWPGLTWGGPMMEEEHALLGPDPYPTAIEANRCDPEAPMAWSTEPGITKRRVRVESLFAPGVSGR